MGLLAYVRCEAVHRFVLRLLVYVRCGVVFRSVLGCVQVCYRVMILIFNYPTKTQKDSALTFHKCGQHYILRVIL